MNNFGVGYAEDLKNGCNSHGEAIILNPSRRDTTIIHYSIFIIHSNSKSLNRAINRNLRHKDAPGEVDPRPGNRFACEAGLCEVGVDKESLTHGHKHVYSDVSVGI